MNKIETYMDHSSWDMLKSTSWHLLGKGIGTKESMMFIQDPWTHPQTAKKAKNQVEPFMSGINHFLMPRNPLERLFIPEDHDVRFDLFAKCQYI